MFKVVIAGGRDFKNYKLLKDKCFYYLKNKMETDEVIVISGHANGADLLGEQFANEFGLKMELYPADWENKGKSAGYIRNAEMLRIADAVICFWDGNSNGTKHMINIASQNNKPLRIIYY